MNKWFVIRADASIKIGIGHLMRCMALAEWAHDHNLSAVLITKELPKALRKKINIPEANIKILPDISEFNFIESYAHSKWLSTSEKTDAQQTANIIQRELLERACSPSFIVVDHYALAAPWEGIISTFGPILCIDDLNDRPHSCKWLIDQTFNKNSKAYTGLINSDCRLFIGTVFALLRKEFQIHKHIHKRTSPDQRTNWNILITLGGVDEFNITGMLLNLLSQTKIFHKMNITTVIGSTNPNIEELKLICNKAPQRFQLLVDASNMAELMLKNDLCIGAAGSTSWERCAMSLPTLMIVLADNQQSIAENLNEGNVCINMGKANNLNLHSIESAILNIMNQPDIYESMAKSSHDICDGLGCKRVLRTVMKDITC